MFLFLCVVQYNFLESVFLKMFFIVLSVCRNCALQSHRLQIYLTFMAELILQMDILPASKTLDEQIYVYKHKAVYREYKIWSETGVKLF